MSSTNADDRQAKRGAALAEITRAVAASFDVSSIFSVVATQLKHILAHDALAVMLLHAAPDSEAGHNLTVAFCHPPTLEAGQAWPLTDFSFGPALLANQSVVIQDLAATAAHHAGDQAILDRIGREAMIVPLQASPTILGGFVLISRTPGLYHPDDVLLVEPITRLVALELEHQRLDQQARALAVVEERNRLAREIHDTLAQSLMGIIINLESLKPHDAAWSRTEREVLAETEALARRALEDARRSVLGLHPTPLQHQSLRDALTPELAGLAKRAGLASQFYVNGEERPLSPDVATALFRIAQESFHNIHKHAAARHVILGLAFEAEAVVLTIEDDGTGFVPDDATLSDTSGFGLLSMAARAHSLGGELLVTSRPGHGTTVRATLPYVRPVIPEAAVVLKDGTPMASGPHARPIRVLLVDDHPMARRGIRSILEGEPDVQVVGEAEDGQTAVEQTDTLRPDVVLLDLQMPRLSGIATLPRLRAAHPHVEVVMLTVFDQDEQVFASLKAGARGYVLKDASPATIVEAIRAASHGQSSLSSITTTKVIRRFTVLAQREGDPDALTVRELEILVYMEKGLLYKEIAAHLKITTNTVQYHVTNIFQKLHVGNRSEAVSVAVQRGLLHRME